MVNKFETLKAMLEITPEVKGLFGKWNRFQNLIQKIESIINFKDELTSVDTDLYYIQKKIEHLSNKLHQIKSNNPFIWSIINLFKNRYNHTLEMSDLIITLTSQAMKIKNTELEKRNLEREKQRLIVERSSNESYIKHLESLNKQLVDCIGS